jgi:uncharacterized protein YbjT (DUF2867 family)
MAARTPADMLVTIYGGSGFLGRHVVRALAKRGYRIRNAVRRPDLAGHLQPLGKVGQIHSVQANVRNAPSIEMAAHGADVLINLVGILYERGKQHFTAVHTEGAEHVAQAARTHGARLVHVSAIGADANSSAVYARSKADAEACVLAAVPPATIMRPSIVFGPEDHFFNRFAEMARMSPVLPLIGGGKTRFQPVYAGDVGEAIARAVDGQAQAGTTYELGGPEVLTFRQCMERMLEVSRRKRMLLPLPWSVARILGQVGQLLPNRPITVDQVRMLRFDNVVSATAETDRRTLPGLGIEPTALEVVLPTYLVRFRERGQFTQVRAAS